jgi:hypothetical protein
MSSNLHRLTVVAPDGTGSTGCVVIDGTDVSAALRAVDLRVAVGATTTATLHLGMHGTEFDGLARLHLSAAQVGLLARFGWTPPLGYQMNDRGDVLLGRLTDPSDPRTDVLPSSPEVNG